MISFLDGYSNTLLFQNAPPEKNKKKRKKKETERQKKRLRGKNDFWAFIPSWAEVH
jgi:hypothetical protein